MIAGIILSGKFSDIPISVAKNAMLTDFTYKKLTDCGLSDISIAKDGSLKEIINNSTADGCLLLSEGAAADGVDFPLFFESKENIRFISESGEFIGAFIVDAEEYDDIIRLPRTEKTDAVYITASDFKEIEKKRFRSVYKVLTENNVFIEKGAFVSPLAAVGKDSFIASGVRIFGKSEIGESCSVTGATYIYNSKIGRNTEITSCVIADSRVGDNVTAGPFAYIRPHSEIGNSVKVGDFVEIKNAVIGNGTKISHLTYVGDSDVGESVNFGCGTVTVNYDGVKKHRTVIGDNVFIGCNTNLVAPVSVGDNAFIAAGSTVTDDVPELSFAIARQRQTTKENYVSEKMPDMVKSKTKKE